MAAQPAEGSAGGRAAGLMGHLKIIFSEMCYVH